MHYRGVPAAAAGVGERLRSTALRTVFGGLKLVPAPLYDRIKRVPALRAPARRLLDAALPTTGLSVATVEAGPIRGLRLELQPRTNKDMAVGRYEPGLVEALERMLQPGDICFDVGAHLGYMSLVMASTVGPGGKVVAFEPDPGLFEMLRRNAARKHGALAPVVPVPAAAGARSGRARFRHGESTGTGRLADSGGGVTVRVVTLDDAVRRHGMPALVKLDVEGAEVEALLGSTNILRRRDCTFIVEAHSDDLEKRCRELLTGFDYEIDALAPARDETVHLLARPPRLGA